MTATIPPIRRRLVVSTGPGDAFRLWTEEIHRWWPLAHYSVFGAEASVAFEDGVLTEHGSDGETAVWGTVLEWEPGERLRMTWHPGQSAERATELEIRFTPVAVQGRAADSTLVELIHSGWERLAEPEAAMAEYSGGWGGVLGRYGDLTADADDIWILLRHSAGPAADPGGRIFDHPDFGEHPAFLQRLRDKGVLIAAGPLSEVSELSGAATGASGMTVIRVPSAEVDRYVQLAREDDQSVVRGLLEVTASRWNVSLTG